jgi:hypothetical protein
MKHDCMHGSFRLIDDSVAFQVVVVKVLYLVAGKISTKGFRKPLSLSSLVGTRLLHDSSLLKRKSSVFTSEEM